MLFQPNQIVIALNSKEPHPRAGISADTKSVWPGLGSKPEILTNHQMVLLAGKQDVLWNEKTQQYVSVPNTVSEIGPLKIQNNPERQDMTEVVRLLDEYRTTQLGLLPIYYLNVIMNAEGNEVLTAGWGTAEGIADTLNPIVEKVYSYPVQSTKALVLETPDPQGQTLEQALKSLAFISDIIQPHSVIAFLASLNKGAGTPHFASIFENKTMTDLDTLLEQSRQNFATAPGGIHTLPSVLDVLHKTRNVVFVPRQPLSPEVINEFKNYPLFSFENSLRQVLRGKDSSELTIITNSTMMVPFVVQ